MASCQQTQDVMRNRCSLRVSQGTALPTAGLWIPRVQNQERIRFCCFKRLGHGISGAFIECVLSSPQSWPQSSVCLPMAPGFRGERGVFTGP